MSSSWIAFDMKVIVIEYLRNIQLLLTRFVAMIFGQSSGFTKE